MGLIDELNERRKKNQSNTPKMGLIEELELRKKYQAINTDGVDQAYIDSFIKDAQGFHSSAEKDYSGINWSNASSLYESKNSVWNDLNTRADTINAWLYKNRNNLDSETYNKLTSDIGGLQSNLSSLNGAFKNTMDFYGQFATEDDYNAWQAEEDHKQSILNSEDFKYYSEIGANIKNPENIDDPKSGLYRGEKVGNPVTLSREYSTLIGMMEANGGDTAEYGLKYKYSLMKDDEVGVYNYYLAKYGEEKANEYLKSLDSTLDQRHAGVMIQAADNTAMEFLFAFGAGVEQFGSGVKNLDNLFNGTMPDNYTSVTTQAYHGMSVNNDGVWKVANDLANTTGNMLPSILLSAFVPVGGQLVGAASMGASATGNAYSEMRNLGYTANQARAYSVMVGASEAALSYALGGISKLGGKVSNHFISNAISKVDNAIAKVAIQLGGSMLSEGVEEGLQSVLEPIFSSIVTGENVDIDWGEVAYSALLGSLSAGLLEGAPTIAGNVAYEMDVAQHGSSLLANKNAVPELQALANSMAGVDTKVDKYSAKVNDKASAKNVGRLSVAMQDSIASQNLTEVQNALVEKGLSKREAQKVAEKLLGSEKLSKKQMSNEDIKAVANELVNNPNSAINERNSSLTAARQGVSYKDGKRNSSMNKSVQTEVAIKDRVSEDGKTTQVSTGEAITIDKNNPIAKTKDGKVYVNTDKGVVESSDVTYANEEEGLIYESFVDLNPGFANALIKNYDGKMPVQSYIKGMREGVVLYGKHNFQGVGKDISNATYFAELSEADQSFALKLGRNLASHEAKVNDAPLRQAIRNAAKKAEAEGKTTDSTKAKEVTFRYDENLKRAMAEKKVKLNPSQKRVVNLVSHLSKALGMNVVIYDATMVENEELRKSNGGYVPETNTLYLDLQNATTDRKTIAYSLSHELVHWLKAKSATDFNNFAKFLMEQYAAHGVDTATLLQNKMAKYESNADEAFEEMIADACETLLLDSNAVPKLMELRKADLNLFEKIMLHIRELINKIRAEYKKYSPTSDEAKALLGMTDVLDQIYAKFEEAMVGAAEVAEAESLMDMEVNTDIVPVESVMKHSYKSLANAAGFEAVENEDGSRSFIREGNKVSKVTVEDIENSPIGAFINYSLEKKDITKEQADEQKKMFAEICTLCCKTNDFSMTMQFMGSEVFTAMKANADKQYGTTYDMPSICTKTQAVIDAMSARMVKLGRGLSTEEITAIYNEVNHAGNPVPCPECYVFSRWIGIGSLLDNIKQYQEYYGKMSVSEVAEAYKKMYAEIETAAAEMEISFGKAKGALVKKYTKEFNKLTEKIEKQENQGEKVKDADRKKLKELESMQNTVKALTWIENVYFANSAHTKVNPNFRVPDDVLFDLNMGEKFATQYKEAWAFRTTQGAGYGKAITPYAEVSLGEGVLVTNNTSNAIKGKQNGTLNNYFLQQSGKVDKASKKALDNARLKQKIQAFLGGQRFQSTSDARYENASDYLLAALEMQAMHGMVQVYTKVDGAVPAFENWGFSTNQSLMPKGSGLDANGNVVDTSVGGMNPKVAFANRNKHEHAGTITIGVNDKHIRALFAMIERDFIIPYHASGGKADVVSEFRRIQEGLEKKGTMVRSTDYSRVQSDKVLSDEVLKWLGKTDAEIEQIHKVRDARIAILTRGKVDMEVVRGNRFLSDLYDKFNGGEWDGVKLAKSKVADHIYPNEFWDTTVTYEESGKITADYLEYCDDLGFLHRFSGLVPSNGMLVSVKGYDENGNRVTLTDLAFKVDENGQRLNEIEPFYWKVLTDRRMYGHNGQYLPQQIVTLNSTTEDTVTTFAKHNDGRQYNKELSLETAKKVTDEAWSGIVEEVGTENIPEATEQYTDVENTTRIKKQLKNTSDNTYENIGKELMYYEEGDLAPDLTLVETINERTGSKEVTIKHHGQKPKGYVPKKIAYCYKLFEQHPDGSLHALFAGAKNGVPIGEWRYAQGFPRTDEGVKGMNLRERYGWHLSAGLPSAPHLMSSKYFERGYPSKGAYGHPKGSKRVWVRMAYDASMDFNAIADSTGKQNDIYGLIPFGGYYAFKENNQSEWVISSAVKIDKILKEDERQQILKEAGYDEYEAWRLKYQPTPEEKAARELANKERAKAKARAKKLGIESELSESTKAMREGIKSRIIDNPELKGIKRQVKEIVGESGTNYGMGVYLDSTLLTGLTEDERVEMVKEYLKNLGGSVFTAYDNNGNSVDVHIAQEGQKFRNKSGRRVPVNKDMTNYLNSEVKQEAIALIDELILASSYGGTEPAHHPHDWLDNNGQNDWDVWTTYLQDKENTVWEAILQIANSTNGEKILYDIFPIKMVEQSSTMDTSTTANNIAQKKPVVKSQLKNNSDRILMGSLFSGGGTLEAGLTYQMLDKQFGVEYDGKIASVYADNHGDHIQVGRVEDFDISKYDDIFYLHASPVCHNFSKAKHGATELQMDIDSARATAKHLETAMPQVFTVENAPGYRKSQSLKIITDKLTELGYKWDVDVYNSADYGSATSRNRVILRAVREGELPPKPSKQERTNSWDKVTRDLWDTLPKSALRPSFISAIENTPNLPILDANGNINVNKPLLILTTTSGHQVTFCWEGEICPTLTTKCGEAKLVMPDGNIYAVTPEFMGRIQGLPDDYKYPKEKTRAFTIIGNGIPTHLTKAVIGGVLDSAYKQTHEGRILFQKKEVSNRTILTNALESTIDTSTQAGQNELKKLREYQKVISDLEKEEAHLAEVKKQIHDISFTKNSDRSKLNALNDDKIKTQNRIHNYDKKLVEYEAMKPIKDVLAREKELVRKKTEAKAKEYFDAYREHIMQVHKEDIGRERDKKKEAVTKVRESRDKQEAKKKLQKLVLETIAWMVHPAKTDVKCPDMLKAPYKALLDSINFDSERALKGGSLTKNDLRIDAAMNSLANAIEKLRESQAAEEGDANGFLDLPGDFVRVLRDMADDITDRMTALGSLNYVVNGGLNSNDIKVLTKLIRTLNRSIKMMNTLYANLRFANAQMLGVDAIGFLDSMGKAEKTSSIKDFVLWDNGIPYYVFKRFGEAGESVFEEFMDAQDKMAYNAKKILEFRENTWTDKEANEWSNDRHVVRLPRGISINLTTADAMSIYCLSRRNDGNGDKQGMKHLLGGGVRIIGIKKGTSKFADEITNLSEADIDEIIDSLSDRQKQVAEAMQEFMSTVGSAWGNEISMKRFLTKDFVEKIYFPIESDNQNLKAELPEASQGDLYRLLNISATKPTNKYANNRLVVRNIFDVFTNHMSDMAKLNAFGMALLDYMKWVNYKESVTTDAGEIVDRSVRQSMNNTYGDEAIHYVLNLIKDINGRHTDNGDNRFLMKMMRLGKTAAVGNNLRVAFLQFTSYPRAAMVLSNKSLAMGLTKVPNIKKAEQYCGIALWKSFGFYDTNIARSIEDQIKGATNIRQKIIELSMTMPGLADAITWGALWNACEYEVAKTTKNKVGSEEFYQEVGKKLREVVYATQVVDSTLTRSQIMRSKSGFTQMATAYMSEPTLTANILVDAGFQFEKEKRISGSPKTAWKKTSKIIIGAVGNYCVLQLLTSLAESLADAWRDDDDEEFGEKFKAAFIENSITNIIPFTKIPIISDIAETALSIFGIGYASSDNMATSWLTQIADAINVWAEVLGKEESSKTVYNAIYKTAKALSSVTGVSVSGAMREVVSLWNNTAGAYDSTLKLRLYESTNAELGNELYEAILEGDERQANSLREQFEDEDEVNSALRKVIGNKYKEGTLSRTEAIDMLVEHGDLDDDEAYWKLKEWDYYVANGNTDDYSKYTEFYEAVKTGRNLKAVIKEHLDHGAEAKDLASQITKYYKPLYKEMSNSERASLKGYLLNAYSLLGYNRIKKSKDIDNWLKD